MADPANRLLGRDLPEQAPSSPRAQTWNRRILGWAMIPGLLTGVVGFIPGLSGAATAFGGAVTVALVAITATQALRARRANQRSYDAARREALAAGGRLRAVTLSSGDLEYRVEPAEDIQPIDWGAFRES